MGFFDLFREKKKEVETRELLLEEIEIKTVEEEKNARENLKKINERARILVKEILPLLRGSLNSINSINLDKRKEDERIKKIVRENISLYGEHLSGLIVDLENFDKKEDSGDILRIDGVFESFLKKSDKSREKATILVGKEFEAIENIFRNFSKEFAFLMKETSLNNERMGKLWKFKEMFNELKELGESEKEIKDNLIILESKKEKNENELLRFGREIEHMIKSELHKNDLERKAKNVEEIRRLENELLLIKNKLDMKDLANRYHDNEKKHKIIKEYMGDFKGAIKGDESGEFSKIIKEARGQDLKLKSIVDKIEELEKFEGESEREIKRFEENEGETKHNIERIKGEIEREGKRVEKIKDRKNILISELKSKTRGFFA